MTIMSKKAELFDKALIDLWQAEQAASFRADATIYSCSQCVEKMIKGVLKCYDIEYDYDHNLDSAYEKIVSSKKIPLTKDLTKHVDAIGVFGNAIRYKNMNNDPSIQDALKILNYTKEIVDNLSSLPGVKTFFTEAYQYNKALLRKSEDLLKKNDIPRVFDDKHQTHIKR